MRGWPCTALMLSLGLASATAAPRAAAGESGLSPVSAADREPYIREAEVWSPIDTAHVDIRRGPEEAPDPGPEGVPTCRFHLPNKKPGGRSDKFFCRTEDGRVSKIKYGVDNKEIYGEIGGTRALWALGFYADIVQPVRLRCLDCPEDPWGFLDSIDDWEDPPPIPDPGERIFEPAIREFYFAQPMEVTPDQGVGWDEILELRSKDPEKAERQRIHREALTLLAGLMEHADSKASNQTLGCRPKDIVEAPDGRRVCSRPVIYIGDIGGGGGYGWRPYLFKSFDDLKEIGAPSKIDYQKAASITVWSDPEKCEMRVYALPNATLRKAIISEEARAFLAARLELLSHEQLLELARLQHADLLGETLELPDGSERPLTHEDRVALAERRLRKEIFEHRCPPYQPESD